MLDQCSLWGGQRTDNESERSWPLYTKVAFSVPEYFKSIEPCTYHPNPEARVYADAIRHGSRTPRSVTSSASSALVMVHVYTPN